jgi:homoserine kinase type II
MDDHQLLSVLPGVLRDHWDERVLSVRPLGGGMNSATALVELDSGRFVAKWVPAAGAATMRTSAKITTELAATGLRTGPPKPTRDGALVIDVLDGCLALLEFVPGRELTATASDQPLVADALGQAHAALGTHRQRADFFGWLGADPALAQVADWILPAIRTVRAEYDSLPPLTWGTLHTDPAPEAFLLDDASGRIGVIDWTGACSGPLLYDVASALMYLGGPVQGASFLDRYAEVAPVPRQELDHHLATFRRFRAIVQADYFGHRILSEDMTGISDAAENTKGLADAYRMLRKLGVVSG